MPTKTNHAPHGSVSINSPLTRRRLLALGISSLLLPSAAMAQQVITPEPLSRFDGEKWSGIILGRTTRDELKRNYRTQGGQFIRAEAMILTPPPGFDGIQALTSGRKGDSVVVGLRLTYRDSGPDIKDLADRLGDEPEVWYPEERYEDWCLQVFPKQGIVAYTLRDGRDERIPQVLLCSPSRINDLLRAYRRDPTEIAQRREIREEDLLPVAVGDVRISFGTVKGVTIRDRDNVQDDLTEDVRRELRSSRNMEYRRGEGGDLSITISINYRNDKGDVSASASLSTETELGKIYASGYDSESIRDEGDNPRWSGTRRLERAVFDALDNLERDVREKVRKQQPPALSTVRQMAWDDLINKNVR
jgi:hypothetical protein